MILIKFIVLVMNIDNFETLGHSWVTQKNVPCFLNIYIYRLNWDISNLFAVKDSLIYVLLLVKILNDWLQY